MMVGGPMEHGKYIKKVKTNAMKKSPRMTLDEKSLVRRMHFDQKVTPVKIAEIVGRSLSAVCRLLSQKKAPKPVGRPKILSAAKVDSIVTKLEEMVDAADGTHEVTMSMLMRRGRLKVCSKVVANALHDRGYWFRDMRHKPILTPDDVKERFAWAKKYRKKTAAWWMKTVHIHLDNHAFKVATTSAGRKLLAKRAVRGVYRQKGKSLRSGHVKPNPKLRLSLGTKPILKGGGVGSGKVLVWQTIEGAWSGQQAADFYSNVVAPALKKQHPGKKNFCILEDNDPTGNTSKKGKEAKQQAKLSVLHLPKRSPDLNVLDFAVWAEVERRMRLQERSWPTTKRETKTQFGARLNRVAKNLPEAFINKAIADLKNRCRRLYQAKGGLIEEGGHCSRRPL
jgi:hypothetical protein